METMEAVELEKQKHNNTRMEVLARLAKLEVCWFNVFKPFVCTYCTMYGLEHHLVNNFIIMLWFCNYLDKLFHS